jgi:hypothetical protein
VFHNYQTGTIAARLRRGMVRKIRIKGERKGEEKSVK